MVRVVKRRKNKKIVLGIFGSPKQYPYHILKSFIKALIAKTTDIEIFTTNDDGVSATTFKICKELGIPITVIGCPRDYKRTFNPRDIHKVTKVTVGREDMTFVQKYYLKKYVLVERIKSVNGILVGVHINNKGSQYTIRRAIENSVPVFALDIKNKKAVKLF